MGRRRWTVLGLVLLCVALSDGHGVRFIQPRQQVFVAGLRGATVPIQVYLVQHPDNRFLEVRWASDTGEPGQCCGKSIDGANEYGSMPIGPHYATLAPGKYTLVALAYADADRRRVRAAARHELQVCGGGTEC